MRAAVLDVLANHGRQVVRVPHLRESLMESLVFTLEDPRHFGTAVVANRLRFLDQLPDQVSIPAALCDLLKRKETLSMVRGPSLENLSRLAARHESLRHGLFVHLEGPDPSVRAKLPQVLLRANSPLETVKGPISELSLLP